MSIADAAKKNDTPWREVLIERGLERCRSGDWEHGVSDLMTASQEGHRRDLPSPVYSFLGYALARTHGDIRRGIRFCKYSLKLEFYHPDNYLNLARTQILSGNRRSAKKAVDQGLGFDPQHPGLIELREELGDRRDPVLPFLGRRSLFNRILGRIRHDLTGSSKPTPPQGRQGAEENGGPPHKGAPRVARPAPRVG